MASTYQDRRKGYSNILLVRIHMEWGREGTGEMAQWPRELAAIAEDPGLKSQTHTTAKKSSSKESNVVF